MKPSSSRSSDRITLAIEGMSCASCVGRVEKALSGTEGVHQATVNLATQRATLEVTPGLPAAPLLDAVAHAGYRASVVDSAPLSVPANERPTDLLLAAALTLPVFLGEMGGHFLGLSLPISWMWQGLLITLVLLGPGRRFYRHGIPALLRGAPDMNSLVALGTLAAWGYSTLVTLAPGLIPSDGHHVYFESAGVIVTLILLGRYLESRAKGRTSEAIRRLIDLQPPIARVRKEGQWVELPVEEVQSGDEISIRPGEQIPVDGEIISGETHIDQSMMTGEPIPVAKSPGMPALGGTMNQTGSITLRATAVGRDTVLARIIQMIGDAQGAKLPIQTTVDRITLWFVPTILAIALATCVIWLLLGGGVSMALMNAIAVLIIACPCAMGLATPISVMVGTGRGAELGILFRKGDALQSLQEAKAIAFDKTGTLTEGRPVLTDLETASGIDRATLLPRLAALEARSEHPIGRAVVEAATAAILPEATGFQAVTSRGIRGEVEGHSLIIGTDRWMHELGLDPTLFHSTAERLASEGKTPVYVAMDGQLAAIFCVADPIKPSAPAMIERLHALGLNIAIISGDNEQTARAIARRLGIEEVVAEVLPDQKVTALQQLRKAHGPVVFIGDGMNDAPSLAEADVGIAIGTGTDIAIEAADVVLMSGDLSPIPTALSLSRATLRNIRQNLFWAFAYNAALIPVAAGVLYPFTGQLFSPMLAAGAMTLSSLFVVGNALRLKHLPLSVG